VAERGPGENAGRGKNGHIGGAAGVCRCAPPGMYSRFASQEFCRSWLLRAGNGVTDAAEWNRLSGPCWRKAKPGRGGISIGVRSRGCSGLTYTGSNMAARREKLDEVVQGQGASTVAIEPKASNVHHSATEMGLRLRKNTKLHKSGLTFTNSEREGFVRCGRILHGLRAAAFFSRAQIATPAPMKMFPDRGARGSPLDGGERGRGAAVGIDIGRRRHRDAWRFPWAQCPMNPPGAGWRER